VEEFRVSLFAQELGTAEPVSVVRLKRALDELSGVKTAAGPAAAPAIVPTTLKKGPPLKSLGSLDQLFRK
jgi:ATP-dependent helicase HrpA